MNAFLIIMGLALLLIAMIPIIGLQFPTGHIGKVEAEFKQDPETIWKLISDHENEIHWRTDLKKMEKLTSRYGNEVWCETNKNGQKMNLETILPEPGKIMIRKIVDNKSFGGNWTFYLEKTDNGTKLTVTENGEIYNPFFRTIFRVFFKPTTTISLYLKMLANHLGEEIEIK